MKSFFRKLAPRRPDEMARHIAERAQRNAYIFLALALLVWSLYESFAVYARHSRLNPLPCLLLVGAALVQGFSQLMLTRRAVKDDDESCETGPLVKIVVLVCVLAAIAATAAAALLLMGIRT